MYKSFNVPDNLMSGGNLVKAKNNKMKVFVNNQEITAVKVSSEIN